MADDPGRSVGRVSLKVMPDLRTFREDLTAGLNEAVRGLQVNMPVLADLDRFKADLEAAVVEASRKTVNVGVDADTAGLAAHLDEATRNRNANIKADADTAAASAELDRAARDRTSHIGLTSSIPSPASLLQWTSLLSALPSLAVSAAGSVLSLAGSLASLAGIAAVGPAALAGLGAVIGTVITATDGMGAAMKRSATTVAALGVSAAQAKIQQLQLASAQEAVQKAESQAADQRVAAAQKVKTAEDGVTQARQQAVQDQTTSSQRVQQAEQALTTAQRNELTAQQALTQARQDAVKALRDLGDNLTDAQLSERQAEITLVSARDNLAKTNSSGSATALNKAQAQLDYDQAVQSLKEARERVIDLTQEKAKADQAGINGSAQVKAAQQQVTTATDATKTASQNLADAEKARQAQAVADAAAIQKAEQAVADARAAQVKAQRDGAQQIADAQRALLQVQLQQQVAAESNRTAVEKQATAMAKLAPNAQSAAKAMMAFADAFVPVKNAVQNSFWRDFAGGFADMQKSLLPQLQSGMPKLAGAIGDNLKEVTAGLKSSLSGHVLDDFFTEISKGAENGKGAIQPLIDAFTTLITVGSKQAGAAGSWIANLGKEFDSFIRDAASSGKLQGWIDNAKTGFHDLGQVIANAAGIVSGFVKAASAGSGTTLGTLADVLGKVRDVVQSPGFQKALTGIFSAAKDGARAIGDALPTVGRAIEALSGPIETFLRAGGSLFSALLTQASKLATELAPALTPVIDTLGSAIKSVLPTVEAILSRLGSALAPLVTNLLPVAADLFNQWVRALAAVVKPIGQLAQAALPPLATILDHLAASVLPPLVQLLQDLIPPITRMVQTLLPPLSALFGALGTAFGDIARAVTPVVTTLVSDLVPVFERLVQSVIPPVTKLISDIAPAFASVVQAAVPLVDSMIKSVVPAFGAVGAAIGILDPILKGLLGGVRSVIGVLDGLPDPAKAALVALLAFKAVSGTGLFRSVAGAVGSLRDSLKGFRDEMALQQGLARMEGTELSTMGAAAATARVRLVSLGQALGKAGLLAAGIVVVSDITSEFGKLATQQSQVVDGQKSIAAALDDSNGKWTKQVQLAQNAAIEGTDFYKDAIASGLSYQDVILGLTGSQQDYHNLQVKVAESGSTALILDFKQMTALRGQKDASVELYKAQQDTLAAQERENAAKTAATGITAHYTDMADQSKAAAVRTAAAFDAYAFSTTKLGRAQDDARQQAVQLKSEWANVTKGLSPLVSALIDTNGQMVSLDTATSNLIGIMDKAAGITPSVTDAVRNFKQALANAAQQASDASGHVKKLSSAVVSAAGDINLNTQAGRDLSVTMESIQQAAAQAAAAVGEQAQKTGGATASTRAMIQSLQQSRSEFLASAKQMGLNATEAQKLADKYLSIPKSIPTKVELDDTDAVNKLNALFGTPHGTVGLIGARKFADGGMLPDGYSIVNDAGPELLYKQGAAVQVITAAQSRPVIQDMQHQQSTPARGPLTIINNYPQAEPTSVTLMKARALDASLATVG